MAETKKILVIDDDPDIVRSVKAILEAKGYAVTTASSGKDGLEVLSEMVPDLILCDMMMERLNKGIRVAQSIRRQNNTVPILLMSSIGESTALNTDIRELGFNGYLQKPVRPETLLTVVAGLLQTE